MRIDAEATGVRRAPAAATLANGDFIVVSESETQAGIRGRRVAGGGSPVGAELRINTSTSGGEMAASVAAAAGAGGFVVV